MTELGHKLNVKERKGIIVRRKDEIKAELKKKEGSSVVTEMKAGRVDAGEKMKDFTTDNFGVSFYKVSRKAT